MTRLRQRLERLEAHRGSGPQPTDGMTEEEIDRRLVKYFFTPETPGNDYRRDAALLTDGTMTPREFARRYKRHARAETPRWYLLHITRPGSLSKN